MAVDKIMENGGRVEIDLMHVQKPSSTKACLTGLCDHQPTCTRRVEATGADADTMTQAEQSALTSGLMSIDDWIGKPSLQRATYRHKKIEKTSSLEQLLVLLSSTSG